MRRAFEMPVPRRRLTGDAARDATAEDEREREEGIDEARKVADPREAARTAMEADGLELLPGEERAGDLRWRHLGRDVEVREPGDSGHLRAQRVGI
jgi:hypothetical protein